MDALQEGVNMEEEFLDLMQRDTGYVARYNEYTKDIQMRAKKLVHKFNNTAPDEEGRRISLLKELFQDENLMVAIEPPFHCDYGFNIHFEGFALLNYNCSILDTSPVYIGDHTFIAPGVCISCAGHAIHPDERAVYDTSKPIHIGEKVWIGANATILAGVNIGDNSIIGAGSVVTKDIPANVIAAGNPCRVLREITDEDRLNLDVEMQEIGEK